MRGVAYISVVHLILLPPYIPVFKPIYPRICICLHYSFLLPLCRKLCCCPHRCVCVLVYNRAYTVVSQCACSTAYADASLFMSLGHLILTPLYILAFLTIYATLHVDSTRYRDATVRVLAYVTIY
jgi:hypothetical protein